MKQVINERLSAYFSTASHRVTAKSKIEPTHGFFENPENECSNISLLGRSDELVRVSVFPFNRFRDWIIADEIFSLIFKSFVRA